MTENNGYTMRYSIPSYLLCLLILTCTPLITQSLTAEESTTVQLIPSELSLGEIDGEAAVQRTVQLTTTTDTTLTRLLSTCPCVSLSTSQALPATLAAGSAITITVDIDPTSYEGHFSKITFIETQATAAPRPTMTRLTVQGTIILEGGWDDFPEPESEKTATPPLPTPTDYTASISIDQLQKGLVLFLTPNCDRCNWVRLLWLPRYYKAYPDATVYTVDVTTQEGIDLLLTFEQTAPPTEKGDAPIAWSQGQLHYGTKAIGNLLSP